MLHLLHFCCKATFCLSLQLLSSQAIIALGASLLRLLQNLFDLGQQTKEGHFSDLIHF